MPTKRKEGVSQKVRNLALKDRITLYNKALRLKKRNSGPSKVASLLGISEKTVEHWFYEKSNPLGCYNMFKEKPSKELSYVIGVTLGDASLWKSGTGRYIDLQVVDADFANKFAFCLTKLVKPCSVKSGHVNRVTIGCKLLYNFLKRDLNYLKPFIERFPKEFIQGVADSEGTASVSVYKHRGQLRFDVRTVVAFNASNRLLTYVKFLLKKFFNIESNLTLYSKAGRINTMKGRIIVTTKNNYMLGISKYNHVKRFNKLIGFSVQRKQKRMSESIVIRNKCGNGPEAAKAWLELYKKLRRKWVKMDTVDNGS